MIVFNPFLILWYVVVGAVALLCWTLICIFGQVRRPWDAMWAWPVICPECGLTWGDMKGFFSKKRWMLRLGVPGCCHVTAEVVRVFRPWRWVKSKIPTKLGGLGR